jgi:predicted nucleotidyltransferase
MHEEIARYRTRIAALCRDFDVVRLEVFGSAARGSDFRAANSDVDFLVEFARDQERPPLEQFFGFSAALEGLLGRPVDLVEAGALKNPFIIAAINRSRETVYAS